MHALLLQVSATLGIARRHGHPDLVRRIERVKNIVDRYVKRATVLLDVHSGDISVSSTLGQGATFTVRLPIDTTSHKVGRA